MNGEFTDLWFGEEMRLKPCLINHGLSQCFGFLVFFLGFPRHPQPKDCERTQPVAVMNSMAPRNGACYRQHRKSIGDP